MTRSSTFNAHFIEALVILCVPKNGYNAHLSCDVQLLLGVLREVLVLFEQVFDHTIEDVSLALFARLLELTKFSISK